MATFRVRPNGTIRAIVRLAPYQPHWQIFATLIEAQRWAHTLEKSIAEQAQKRSADHERQLAHDKRMRNQALVQTFMAHVDAGTTPILTEALERYEYRETAGKRGCRNESRRIAAWKRLDLAQRPLDAIHGVHLANYRDSRLDAGMAANTVRLDLAVISHLYTVARTDWGFDWVNNPCKGVRKPKPAKGRTRRRSPEEEAKLLSYCDERGLTWLKVVVIVAIDTAMRRGEFGRLEWRAVDSPSRLVFLDDTKNGDSRVVPLTRRAVASFELIWPHQPLASNSVFPVHVDNISQEFQAACKACDIDGMRLHDLRHEGTSLLFEKGFAIMATATVTGHKTLQMLKRYTHLDPRNFFERLG